MFFHRLTGCCFRIPPLIWRDFSSSSSSPSIPAAPKGFPAFSKHPPPLTSPPPPFCYSCPLTPTSGIPKNGGGGGKGGKSPTSLPVATVVLHSFPPNRQRTLNKLATELRCRNFCRQAPTGHAKSAPKACKKTCLQCVHVPTELPSCMPPLVVGSTRLWWLQ